MADNPRTNLATLQAKPLRQVGNVRELLINDQAREQLSMVAAKHLNPQRMMRLMANAIRTTPKIAECDPMSLLGGLMTCAGLGLEPNTVLGHAYLIPFRNKRKGITEVQLVVGYKGLIDLARRSGHITSISANIHYSDDPLWDYEEGCEAKLRHVPGPRKGDKLHAYAIAKFKDGGHAWEVLPWEAVIARRDGSQGWKTAVQYNSTAKSPWHTHEDEMAKKTAVRSLAKMLPLSTEFMRAVEIDGGQADYETFAMDPGRGLDLTPADDGDLIEGEVGGDEPEPEPGPEAEPEKKAKPKVKAEKKEDPEREPAKKVEPERKAEPEEGDGDKVLIASKLYNEIMGDLLDAQGPGDVDKILKSHADSVDQIKGVDPKLHKRLIEESEDMKETFGEGKEDQGNLGV